MKGAAAIALMASLCGCAGGSMSEPTGSTPPATAPIETLKPVKLNPKQVATLHAGVRRSLKDPESARFGKLVAGHGTAGLITVCGIVNARNSYGGYTGDKPYMATITDRNAVVVIGMGGTDIETRAVMDVCSRYGLEL